MIPTHRPSDGGHAIGGGVNSPARSSQPPSEGDMPERMSLANPESAAACLSLALPVRAPPGQ